jgi:hypothetical protein
VYQPHELLTVASQGPLNEATRTYQQVPVGRNMFDDTMVRRYMAGLSVAALPLHDVKGFLASPNFHSDFDRTCLATF